MGVEEAGRLREQAARLIAERRGLERGLVGRHRLLGGSLLERPNLCGKAGCKCIRSEPRASSLYLIRLEGGTPRHVFVRAADHKRVRREDPAHRQFRQAVRRWRAVVKELNLPWEALGEAQGGAMDPSFFDAKAVSNYRESC